MPPFETLQCQGLGTVKLEFRFQVNGVTHPDHVISGFSIVSDITRESAGLFTITLCNNVRLPVLVNCLVGTEVGNRQGSFVSYTAATGALVVRISENDDDATPDEADPADDTWVHVSATLCAVAADAPDRAI